MMRCAPLSPFLLAVPVAAPPSPVEKPPPAAVHPQATARTN